MADATYEEELKVTLESSDAVKALADLERAIGAYLKNAKELEKPVEVAIDTTAAVKELSKIDKMAAGATKGLASLSKPVKMVFTAVDQATKVMQKIEGVAMKIVKKPYNLVMGVIDKATPVIQAIGHTAEAALSAAATATAVAGTAVAALGVSSFEAAARVSEMNATLGALAKSNGLAQSSVDEAVKSTKAMGIETAVAQETVAKMIQSQLDLGQASKLARVAQDAAVIGSVNSSEALDRLIHGITTQQTDVLRGIGIQVDANAAQEAYAKTLGKTTKQLTAAEKSTAMMNAVLAEGAKIAGTYEAAMQEPGKVLRSFPRQFMSIKESIGAVMLDSLGPFILAMYDLVSAFAKAVGAGGPLNQVLQAIGDWMTRILGPLTQVIKNMTDWIKSLWDAEDAVHRVTRQLSDLAPVLMPVIAALAAMGGANIKGLLGPLGMLIPTINPIVAAFAGLVLSSDKVRKNVVDMASAIYVAFTKDAGAIGVVYDLLTEMFGPTLANAMQPILQRIMEFMAAVRETGGWVEFLKGKFNDLRTALDPVIERLTRLAVNVLGTINRYMPQIALIVGNLAQAFRNLVGPSIDAVTAMNGWDDVERKMDKVMRKLVKMSERMKDLGKWVGENTEKVGKFIKVLGLWDVAGRILPGVGKGAGIALKVIGGIAGFIPKIASGLGSVTGVIGKVMGAVKGGGGLLGIVSALPGPLKAVATAFLAWPGPIKIIITLIPVIIALLLRLWRESEGFREAVTAIWESVSTVIASAARIIGVVLKSIVIPVLKELRREFEILWPVIQRVMTLIVKIIAVAAKVIAAVFDFIATLIEKLQAAWEASGGNLVTFITQLGTDIVTFFWNALQAGMEFIGNWISDILAAWEPGSLLAWAVETGTAIVSNLMQSLTAGLSQIGGWMGDVLNALVSGAGSVLSWALDFGKNIVQNIIDGLLGMLGGIADAASQIGSTISGAISGAVGAVTTGGAVAAAIPGGRPGETATAPAVVADRGSILPSGFAAFNTSGRDEYVLPPDVWSAINTGQTAPSAAAPGRGPVTVNLGGITVNAEPGANGAVMAEQIARILAPRLQAALGNIP